MPPQSLHHRCVAGIVECYLLNLPLWTHLANPELPNLAHPRLLRLLPIAQKSPPHSSIAASLRDRPRQPQAASIANSNHRREWKPLVQRVRWIISFSLLLHPRQSGAKQPHSASTASGWTQSLREPVRPTLFWPESVRHTAIWWLPLTRATRLRSQGKGLCVIQHSRNAARNLEDFL